MRNALASLRQRRADLLKSGKNMLAVAEKEQRDLTDAEQVAHYKVLRAMEQVDRAIILEESRLSGEDVGHAFSDENSLFAAAAHGQPLPENPLAPKRKLYRRVGVKSWADIFGQAPQSTGGFRSLEEYLHSVKVSGQVFDPRLQASATEKDASNLGFLVPEQWSAIVLQRAIEESLCIQRCQVWNMTSNVLKVPGIQDPDHSSGTLFGGLQEIWYDENVTLDDQNLKDYLIQLTAHKLGILSSGSSEIVEDSPSFETVLTAKIQAAAQFFLDKAFLWGSGVNKPQGMLDPSNPALIVATKNAKTPTGSIIWEDCVQMYTQMAPACRARTEWVFSTDLLPALSVMQIVVRNVANTENVGGSSTPMFTMNADGTGTLLGRPAHFSEKMKTAGTQGDAAFICFDQYAIGIARELQLRRSLEAGFVQDQVFWKLTTRVDGQSTWDKSMKLANGQVTSPFVVLQAR